MSRQVNKQQLAEILGYSERSLTEFQAEAPPLPILREAQTRGQSHVYDTAAVIAWLVDRAVRKVQHETQRDRLTRLQADLAEREIAKQDGALVPADQVEPVWMNRAMSAAAFLHGEPSRLAAILEATVGVEAKRQVLKKEFADFLTRLGTEGERMQGELEGLFSKVADNEVQAFLRRITGRPPAPPEGEGEAPSPPGTTSSAPADGSMRGPPGSSAPADGSARGSSDEHTSGPQGPAAKGVGYVDPRRGDPAQPVG